MSEPLHPHLNYRLLPGSLLGIRLLVFAQLAVPVVMTALHGTEQGPVDFLRLYLGFALLSVWNQLHVRTVTQVLFADETWSELSFRRTLLILAVMWALGAYCHSSVPHGLPEGNKLWFYMMPEIAGGMIMRRRALSAAAVFGPAFFGAGMEYWLLDSTAALRFLLHALAVSGFIALMVATAVTACRQGRELSLSAKALAAANEQIAQQAQEVARLAVSEDRNRMASDIHDAVGHTLTVTGAQLDAAAAVLKDCPESALASLRKAREANQASLTAIRQSIYAIKGDPGSTLERTLAQAIQSLLDNATRPGLELRLSVLGPERDLPVIVAFTLQRCAQEAITNVLKHSSASTAQILLDYTDPQQVRLIIRDKGKGLLTSTAPTPGLGLSGIANRGSLLGGSLQLSSTPEWTFVCEFRLPY
jgi:signal transduction histidine kinase